jgi:hypothetical protein
MSNFAVIDENNNILNTIICESKELAEQVTGHTCIEFTTESAETGGSYDPVKQIFIKPRPFPSWTLDDNSNWVPPTPAPVNQYVHKWSEVGQEWVQQPDPVDWDSV